MASQNNLLNGVTLNSEPVNVATPTPRGLHTPCFIFHRDCLQGKIVKTDDEYYVLIAEGWMENIKELKKKIAEEDAHSEVTVTSESDYEIVTSDEVLEPIIEKPRRGRKPGKKD
jgi:hypothetical protein